MSLELLKQLAPENSCLVKFPRKPPPPDHPWRKGNLNQRIKKWNDLTEERNSRWLNDWKPVHRETVMWTKEFYSIDQLENYGYRLDKDHGRVSESRSRRFII